MCIETLDQLREAYASPITAEAGEARSLSDTICGVLHWSSWGLRRLHAGPGADSHMLAEPKVVPADCVGQCTPYQIASSSRASQA